MINVSFYLRRLHSLCGLLLLGGVLIEHLLTNASAMGGPEVFNQGLEMMELIPAPIFLAIEICLYAVPILFHGIYGIVIALDAKNNTGSYGYSRNWKFALQRYTAWYMVAFLIWHILQPAPFPRCLLYQSLPVQSFHLGHRTAPPRFFP